jgi:hypothetical protein
MLFKFEKSSRTITPCDETDFVSNNIYEVDDIEKWIKSYPDLLQEEILILTTEMAKFDSTKQRLDILGIDKEGTLVIIELKRDNSGKNAHLQALNYAAFCSNFTLKNIAKEFSKYRIKQGEVFTEDEAERRILAFLGFDDQENEFELNHTPRIILVSKEFRKEVTATAFWLNSEYKMDITCIKLTPYILDDDTIALSSTVLIPLPEIQDFLVKYEVKATAEHNSGRGSTEPWLHSFEFLNGQQKVIGADKAGYKKMVKYVLTTLAATKPDEFRAAVLEKPKWYSSNRDSLRVFHSGQNIEAEAIGESGIFAKLNWASSLLKKEAIRMLEACGYTRESLILTPRTEQSFEEFAAEAIELNPDEDADSE